MSGPESKLSNTASKGRSQSDTTDEIMLETGTRSTDRTCLEPKESREMDETYVMGSSNIYGGGVHGDNASSERFVKPWQGRALVDTVSVVDGSKRRDAMTGTGRL